MKKFASFLLTFLLFSCDGELLKKEKSTEITQDERPSEDFVQGSEDIPLLIGMEKISDESLGFDSPSGSIMSSAYESKIDLEKVRNFYLRTLPQLGWKVEKNDLDKTIFKRERETLEIEFVNQNGKDIVRFFISSAL